MTTTNSTGALEVAASAVPWYPGECVITTGLAEQGGQATFTATLRYEPREARDVVLGTPMEHGVAECYDKLAELLASTR